MDEMNPAVPPLPGGTAPARARRRRAARLRAPLALGAAVAVAALPAAHAAARAATPGVAHRAVASALGTQQWATQAVAPGVEVSTVTIRDAAARPFWTVTVEQPTTSRLTGAATAAEVGPAPWAAATAARLRTAGFAPRVEDVAWPDYADTPHGLMGERVRVGDFATQAMAASQAQAVTAAGFKAIAEWTGYDVDTPADLENIHVAVIDPRYFTGTVEATHDGDVARRATTSSVAAALHSLVATNGGFFVTADSDGVQGTQSGLGVYGGQLQSLAAGSRAALVVRGGGTSFSVGPLSSSAMAGASGSHYAVQGVNRVPGIVRDCGQPGATPSTLPWQDVDCYETNDLVRFTGEFAAPLPTGAGAQAVLDSAGRVVSLGARGGTVPAGDTVLQGIGTAATWLDAHARPGTRVTVATSVRDAAGRTVPLGGHDGVSIASAAPMLVQDGRIDIDAATEGTVDPRDLSFGYAWADQRQPRTIAGVDARGRLILVTVDGRLAGGSEGFTLQEEAEFIRSLGAMSAMNLDGGGSTAMAVDGQLVDHTSDATGERAVGDTVQVLPTAR